MTIFIGTDEAGYGPNLGPLVVSASCWHFEAVDNPTDNSTTLLTDDSVEESLTFPVGNSISAIKKSKKDQNPHNIQRTFFDDELFEEESEEVDNNILDSFHSICRQKTNEKGDFPIIDSKKLFKASGSLSPLEKTFLRAILWTQGSIHSLSYAEVLTLLEDDSELPFWEKDQTVSLPIDPRTNSLVQLKESFKPVQSYFEANRISLLKLTSRRVFPNEFNEKTKIKLKSDFLAEITLSLVSKMFDFVACSTRGQESIIVLCDKLGGRNKYETLLTSFFPDAKISILCESRILSVYRMTIPAKDIPLQIEIRFQMKGESNIPTALASICSKYLREISMKMFNHFWRHLIPNLQPTAGYPVDARRFYQDIQKVKEQLNLNDFDIWRNK